MKRKCLNCGKEIKECMGFVLARDIVDFDISKPLIRELCEKCSWLLASKKYVGVEQR